MANYLFLYEPASGKLILATAFYRFLAYYHHYFFCFGCLEPTNTPDLELHPRQPACLLHVMDCHTSSSWLGHAVRLE